MTQIIYNYPDNDPIFNLLDLLEFSQSPPNVTFNTIPYDAFTLLSPFAYI